MICQNCHAVDPRAGSSNGCPDCHDRLEDPSAPVIVNTCGQCNRFDSTVPMRYIYSNSSSVIEYRDDPIGGRCEVNKRGTRETSVACKEFKLRTTEVTDEA